MKAIKMQRVAIAIFVVLLSALALAAVGGYHEIGKYSFPAAQGSTREYFDYIAVDSASRRVYLSHGTEIIVMDADTGAIKGTISGLTQDHVCAVMCAEAVWWRCHRRIIADHLLAAAEQVKHILGKSHVDVASLTPGAVVRNDGTVIYPEGPQSG